MSEISRDQACGGSTDDAGRSKAYEPPLLKRLGSIAEVTQGSGGPRTTDTLGVSV